jgi:peroxiredoxin
MKAKWVIVPIAALLGAVGVFYFFKPDGETVAEPQQVNDLPMLNVQKEDGSSALLHDLKGKTVLIFFNSDCDHCQNEAEQISGRKQIFQQYQVYFISADSMKNITKFADDYKLRERNFYFAQADSYQVYKTVGDMPSIPAIFIYNNKRLIKKFAGEVKLEDVMKYL